MKPILDLTKAIGDVNYFLGQFTKLGTDKNILFINPQLSGKCLYKMILPFFSMYNEKVATAISGLMRYDYEGQLLGGDEVILTDEMIEWSDFIVFPFTTQPLVAEYYERIRKVNQDSKIVFLVDFNFYELPDLHPYKKVFDEPTVMSAVEDNIWFSDICLTSNAEFTAYLLEKFKELQKIKYYDTYSNLVMACMPYMIDTEIALKNIEFDPMKPVLINPNEHDPTTKSHIDEVEKTADAIKEADMADKNKYEAVDKGLVHEPDLTGTKNSNSKKEVNSKGNKENGNSSKKSEPRTSKQSSPKQPAKRTAKSAGKSNKRTGATTKRRKA